MNLDFHKLLLNALKAVCFSVFVVKFYQKMIHHTFRYTTINFIVQGSHILLTPSNLDCKASDLKLAYKGLRTKRQHIKLKQKI